MHAVGMDDLRALRFCLNKHADVQADPNGQGKTAVHIAAAACADDCLDALLSLPLALIDAQDTTGCTPLHHAIMKNSHTTVGMLLIDLTLLSSLARLSLSHGHLVQRRAAPAPRRRSGRLQRPRVQCA